MEIRHDGPATASWRLILAHGAGQGMDSDFMTDFATQLARQGECLGGLRVSRFEFPYMARRRQGSRPPPDRQPVLLDAWQGAIEGALAEGGRRERLLIGGKSLGGRMASLIADRAGVAGLVCLGYPFHPTGKPDKLRTQHLEGLATPTLILQGSRDPFGGRDEVTGYPLSPAIRVHWLEDGDHSFKPRKASGRTETGNRREAIDRIIRFIQGLDPESPSRNR